jgi:two-component system, NarL family, nitrate/nitrite response regulator NarL
MELPLVHLDKSQLCRAGFRHIVQRSPFHVGWDGFGWREARPAILNLMPVMVVIDPLGDFHEFGLLLEWLRSLTFHSKIVLFSAKQSPDDVVPFVHRIDGYMRKSMSADAIVHSLQLIHSGQKIFPSEIIDVLADPAFHERHSAGLSARELQILGFLRGGHSNKRIANDLSIAEGTVKVQASNRTQAAMWAVANGIAAE